MFENSLALNNIASNASAFKAESTKSVAQSSSRPATGREQFKQLVLQPLSSSDYAVFPQEAADRSSSDWEARS